MNKPTFALIGCGYVGLKHGRAIKAVGGELVAACDVHDNVGWLDKDWLGCRFTCDPLESQIEPCELPEWSALWTEEVPVDWIVIATPNWFHARMVELYMPHAKIGVICEKPLCLSWQALDYLAMIQRKTGKRLHAILNLRHSGPALRAKAWADENRPEFVEIEYRTPRGLWYRKSWKARPEESGGIIFNIGIHILDWLVWTFGQPHSAEVTHRMPGIVTTKMVYDDGMKVCVRLITDRDAQQGRTIRMTDASGFGRIFDLTNEFAELHTECYREIIAGGGPGIEEVRPSIKLAQTLTEGLS